MAQPNLLESGIYTVPEAAYLVRTTQRKVRGWVSGYDKHPPIIKNELGYVDGRLAFSFANLMEMRFIAYFESHGVHHWHIRAIMDEVKRTLRIAHPFATKLVFRTDGRKIIAEMVEKSGYEHLLDLKTKNWELRDVVYDTLIDDVIYDADGLARAWYPRQHTSPNILIHPKFAFGQPILRDSRIPTHTISDAVRAEGGIRPVAKWFEIPEKQVKEAHLFEMGLRVAREARV